MEMTSTRNVPAPVATVWAALNDPAVLKGCIPGCDAIEPDGENAYRIALAARIGPVAAKFTGRMQLADIDPPNGYTLSFDGQGGAAGFAKGDAKVSLEPAENGAATTLSYIVNAQVGGKIAQIGSRLVDGAAQKLADDFFERFSEAVAATAGLAPAAAPAHALAAKRPWVRYVAIAILVGLIAYLASNWAR
ncbi:MAG: carbon monoxide dehydrogenase subunit G [Casimicrobiaceae bacterium]